MELVPATLDDDSAGDKSVSIATADRRLTGIRTVAAKRAAATRTITAVGLLEVDETRVARIPTDSAGRVEKLFFNYTGQRIEVGEKLATFYSPELYAAQIELLTLKQTRRPSAGRRYSLADVRREIISAARQRLRELGMTADQIASVEQSGSPLSRVPIYSPQSGTITKLLLREGQYLKAGDVVCEVADLTNVWLVTQLFPEDAALVRYGQRVSAHIRSLPGQPIEGRVSFVSPMVDSMRRAVNVRIDLKNVDHQLRPGDEATIAIETPLQPGQLVYDDQLAGQFICPVHPDVIQSSATICPRSGRRLIAAEEFGFAATPSEVEQPLLVPRSAVLMADQQSAVYVEVEEGEFEIRVVTLGSRLGDSVVVLSGLEEAEKVATDGNFLIDSQMQLSGKPSLIDPSRAMTPEQKESPFEIEMPEFGAIEILDEATDRGESVEPPAADKTDDDWNLPIPGVIQILGQQENGTQLQETKRTRREESIAPEDDWGLPDFGTLQLIEDGQRRQHD